MQVLDCLRCGHRWVTEIDHRPTGCARCKSKVWDRPRRLPQSDADVVQVSLADILARLDAMEQAVATLQRAHQQSATPRRQTGDNGQTLDYDAF